MGNTNTTKLTLEEKKCSKCGNVKSLDEFGRNKNAKDKKNFWCKPCNTSGAKAWREANLQKRKEYDATYQQKNFKKISKRMKAWRQGNRESIASCNKRYYKLNKEKVDQKSKRWIENNREKWRANKRRYQKARMESDTNYALGCRLRWRLSMAIRSGPKKGSAVSDLGCSIPELKQHIESQFNSRMRWDNWGTYWHLDHIYPLSAVDLSDRVQFLAANNWQNLQPLTVVANVKKKASVTPAARRLFNKLVKKFS